MVGDALALALTGVFELVASPSRRWTNRIDRGDGPNPVDARDQSAELGEDLMHVSILASSGRARHRFGGRGVELAIGRSALEQS